VAHLKSDARHMPLYIHPIFFSS